MENTIEMTVEEVESETKSFITGLLDAIFGDPVVFNRINNVADRHRDFLDKIRLVDDKCAEAYANALVEAIEEWKSEHEDIMDAMIGQS